MACNCSTTTSGGNYRFFMRIDNIVFNKQYVSRLEFRGLKLYIYYVGECNPYIFDLSSEKSNAEIANYLLQLNTCVAPQEDMDIDDHRSLINLDVPDQHEMAVVKGLIPALENLKLHRIDLTAEEDQAVFELNVDLTQTTPLVFVDGVLQPITDYTISATSITFNTSLIFNTKVIIIYN